MPHEIQIPRLGWSMEQGTFVGWLKKNGDAIKPSEALFTLEGEKAIQEIEAVDAGILHFDPNNPREGEVVAVGAVIGFLLSAGETAPPIQPRPALSPLTPSEKAAVSEGRPHAASSLPKFPAPKPSSQRGEGSKAFATPPASPAVRRLARQLGVDLAPLVATGRISEADVCRRYLQSRGEFLPTPSGSNPSASTAPITPIARTPDVPRRGRNLPAISPRAVHAAVRHGIDWTQLRGSGANGRIRESDVLAASTGSVTMSSPATHAVPITPLRRTIAGRMIASLQQTAPVTLTSELDVTALVEFREQLKRSGEPLIPSITDAIAKLAAIALREHPTLNARWRDDALELFDEVHIGIAVDTDAGLLVPVIRNVHRQSVFEIARQSRELIEKARARRLTAQDLQGGTFTITNLGSLGIDAFTPIINFPETAILGLGRIQSHADRQVMTLSLTFDHRVLDGAPAARFLQTLARLATTDSPSLFEPTTHR